MYEAVRRANPQRAILADCQRLDRVRRQVSFGVVVDNKIVAIETRQTLIGADPEGSVRRLCNRGDCIFGNPLLLIPDGNRVLREGLARTQGRSMPVKCKS